jgi:DNA polymerase-3 subunit beta
MRLQVAADALSQALVVARSAVESKPPVPALGMVLLDASADDGLVVTGADLEGRAWRQVCALVAEPGAVCLPPDPLTTFLVACRGSETVTVTATARHRAELVCGRARTTVVGLPSKQFPPAPDFSNPSYVAPVSAPELADLIASVAHAAVHDRPGAVLSGVSLRIEQGRVTLTAADSFRMAIRVGEEVADSNRALAVVVSAKGLERTAKAMAGAVGACLFVDAQRTMLLISSDAGSWAMRLLEGQYPDVERVIPTDPTTVVTLDRTAFRSALQLTRGIDDADVGFKTRFTIEPGSLLVRAADAYGERTVEMELEAQVEGEPLRVSFNGKYMLDALQALWASRPKDDQVCLRLLSATRAIVLVSPDDTDGAHRQGVMPIADGRE